MDFPFFVEQIFLLHPEYAPFGEMERDICQWIADTSNKKRGVLAARGVGKSTFGSAGYASWCLFRDPNTKILIVSKSKIPQARDIVRLIRGWLRTVWFLQHLDPGQNYAENATDQTFQFDVNGSKDSKTPSVLAQGVEGHLPGSRAHVVIADDIETDANTKTVNARNDLDNKVNEFANIATFGDREVIVVGTLWHEESVYIKLTKRERPYAFRTWPFTYPLEGEKFLGLAPLIEHKLANGTGKPGTPTFSHRYTMDDVAERQGQGRMNWLKQHQLVCNLADSSRYPLKLSDLIVYPMLRDKAPVSVAWGRTGENGQPTSTGIQVVGWEGDALHAPIHVDREWMPFTGTKAFVDPAGRGTDKTGLAIIGHLGGYLWVKGSYGLEGGSSSERLDEIARLCREHGVNDVYYERNIDTFDTYGPLLEEALKRHFLEPGADPRFPNGWKCSLESRHASGQKELRIIQAIEPVLSTHRLVIHPDAIAPRAMDSAGKPVPKEHELQWQIAAITKERGSLTEDGRIDALASCIKEWLDVLNMNPQKAAVVARRAALDKEIDEHFRLTNRVRSRPRWFTNEL